MSLLNKKPQTPKTTQYVNFGGTKNDTFPLNKEPYYFMALFGYSEGQEVQPLSTDSYQEMDYKFVPSTTVSFWVHSMNEGKGGFVKWHYTGENDPVNELGLNLPVAQQSDARYQEIWQGKVGFKSQHPRTSYFLPVQRVEKAGKDYKVVGDPMIIVVTESLMKQLVTSANSDNIVDNSSGNMFGRVFSLSKVPGKPSTEMYSAEVLLKEFDVTDEMVETATSITKQMVNNYDTEVIATTSSDGSANTAFSPEGVKAYVTAVTGMNWTDFVEKYNVFNNLELVDVEETDF
ncbi:MAG: hypothetical protein KDH96_03965 [Candidatus Riesia sp.]|nr:hypothetical protein [Candidatus Riesia sp.]